MCLPPRTNDSPLDRGGSHFQGRGSRALGRKRIELLGFPRESFAARRPPKVPRGYVRTLTAALAWSAHRRGPGRRFRSAKRNGRPPVLTFAERMRGTQELIAWRNAVPRPRPQVAVFFRRRACATTGASPRSWPCASRSSFSRSPVAGARAWGVPPCPETVCTVVIERRAGGRWTPVSSVAARQGRVFWRTVAARGRPVMRARIANTPIVSLETLPRRL